MFKKIWILSGLALILAATFVLSNQEPVLACGGFFCQNSPVDQNAERIIFTQNRDGTISAYVQIQYTGGAEDFSWILPLPHPITAEDIEVPEDAMAAFAELDVAPAPVFIPPPLPRCAQLLMRSLPMMAFSAASEKADVVTFATGEVGPYAFDVVGSEDPNALIDWLRDHDYQVTEEMEPLIDVYVQEGAVFLAMQLLPEQGAQDVQPVKITYPSDMPMIPLRLTAVAANQDMQVMTWFYAEKQAVPLNYAEMRIMDQELIFTSFGTSNYRQLMGEKADEYGGQAFITEYAAPTRELVVTHPLLQQLGRSHPYVTRLNTVISPEEMTVDPVFWYDSQRKDVSNIHDLSGYTGLFACESPDSRPILNQGGQNTTPPFTPVPRHDPLPRQAEQEPLPPQPYQTVPSESLPWGYLGLAGEIGAVLVVLMGGLVLLGMKLGRRPV